MIKIPEPPASGPSMRSIARIAGVSAMTVSRVLRNVGRVSSEQREHVRDIANELGYRPDPVVSKLMHHLRQRRKTSFQGSLCAITTVLPAGPYTAYAQGIMSGARQRAEARGYAFDTLHIEPGRNGSRSLRRILRGRGVEGVILLPMAVPTALPWLADWTEFSLMATTSSVTAPEIHRVTPHHFRNTMQLCQKLRQLGYRRIGLAQSAEHVERVYHAFNAAVAWHGIYHENHFTAPFIFERLEPKSLAAWYEREQPDVIVAHCDRLCHEFARMLGFKIPGPVGFATTNTEPGAGYAGIDERTEEIGAVAIDLLTGLIQRGEKGVPAMPAATQLMGRWVDGHSCPARPYPTEPTSPKENGRPPMIFFSE